MMRRCLGCGVVIYRASRCPSCLSAQKSKYDGEYRRLRPIVLERDEHVCMIKRPGCTGTASTVDHVDGPENTLENLRAACVHCNSGRRDRG